MPGGRHRLFADEARPREKYRTRKRVKQTRHLARGSHGDFLFHRNAHVCFVSVAPFVAAVRSL